MLLITSRRSRHWLIPKGHLMPGLSWWAAAAQEAYEEAGAIGRIADRPVGEYRYRKSHALGLGRRCVVSVYPLAVERQMETWPEMDQRAVRWVAIGEAAQVVKHAGLRRLLARFRPEEARARPVAA